MAQMNNDYLIFNSSLRIWLTEAINVYEREDFTQRPGNSQKQSGEVGPYLAKLSHLNLKCDYGSQRPLMVWLAQRPLRTQGTVGNTREGRPTTTLWGPALTP